MLPGRRYRHIRQTDVDFFVTSLGLTTVTGYWVTRATGRMLHSKPDALPLELVDLSEWDVVRDELDDETRTLIWRKSV